MTVPLVAVVAGMLVTALGPSDTAAKRPWDAPSFKADPHAMQQAIAAVPAPKGADWETFLREITYRFDAEGRESSISHQVYRILTREAVEDGSYIEGTWSPWYEERPTLQARVITPDGEVHWLDEKSIGEVPVDQDSPLVTSDRRILRAPLPAVCVGAIVETEVTTPGKQPFFSGGVARHIPLCAGNPLRFIRVRVETPEKSPLRYLVRSATVQPTVTTRDGRQELLLEMEPKVTFRSLESFKPPEMALWPELVFATGKSWKDVASEYVKIVERQGDQEAVESLVREAVGQEREPTQVARKLLAKLHSLVRYAGVEFGDAGIVPRTPREILARRYGDCKDQAALLVTMLRIVGIPAHVALLSAGQGPDVVPDMPGLGLFNHAIVYLPKARLWIDPTARYVDVGRLPSGDQGRWALVASNDSQALMQTPTCNYRDNVLRETYEIHLAPGNDCWVQETTFATGEFADDLRYWYGTRNKVDLRKAMREYGKSTYYAGELLRLEYTPPDELAKPFERTVQFGGASLGQAGSWGAQYTLSPVSLFSHLPGFFLRVRTKEEQQEAEEGLAPPVHRQGPLQLSEPHRRELTYRIVPPNGCALRSLPTSASHRFGQVTIVEEYRLDGQTLVCHYRLDTGPGRFTASEAEALREGMAKLGVEGDVSRWELKLWFDNVSERQRSNEAATLSLADCRQAVLSEPNQWEHHQRYSLALSQAGLGEPAREAARRAVELAPSNPAALAVLAGALSQDPLGNVWFREMDRQGALRAWRTAVQIAPDNGIYHISYAFLLERDDDGLHYAPEADCDLAVDEYRKAKPYLKDGAAVDLNIAMLYFVRERWRDALDAMAAHPDTGPVAELRFALLAAEEGAEAAEQRITKVYLVPEKRREMLEKTARYLADLRCYDQQRKLAAAAALLTTAKSKPVFRPPSRDNVLRRIDLTARPQTAKDLVQQALALLMYHGRAPHLLDRYFSAETNELDRNEAVDTLWNFVQRAWLACAKGGLWPARAGDLASLLAVTSEGDDNLGYAVRIRDGNLTACCYVVKESSEYRLVGPGPRQSNLALLALRHLERGESPAARLWLFRAYQEHKGQVGWADASSGTPFGQLWYASHLKGDMNLELTAAALLAEARDGQRAAALLTKAKEAGVPGWSKLQVDRALSMALLKSSKPREALDAMKRVLDQKWVSPDLVLLIGRGLQAQGMADQARSVLSTWIPRFANDPRAQEILASFMSDLGEFSVANTTLRGLVQRGKASSASYNILAWNSVVQGKVNEQSLADALKAVELGGDAPAPRHTLATVCAELGKPEQAIASLRLAVLARGQVIEPSDWYVLGRIAEHYQLHDWARKYYQRLPHGGRNATSVGMLGNQRLSKLPRR